LSYPGGRKGSRSREVMSGGGFGPTFDFDTYVGFRCSKKIEKHWFKVTNRDRKWLSY